MARRKGGHTGDVYIVRTDHGASSAHKGGRMYGWEARRADGSLIPGSSVYDSPTDYARKGGSGKGVALKCAFRELGFNSYSDAILKRTLESYPHDSNLRVEEGNGALHVSARTNGRGRARAGTRKRAGSVKRNFRTEGRRNPQIRTGDWFARAWWDGKDGPEHFVVARTLAGLQKRAAKLRREGCVVDTTAYLQVGRGEDGRSEAYYGHV